MIRCIAVDDEPLALEQLKSYIKQVPFLDLIAACLDTCSAMKIMVSEKIDALFIDINMPDLNGLDFIRSLHKRPLVVFTTAYSEYAIEAYKVDAIDYLLKPFGLYDFQRAANKVLSQYNLIYGPSSVENFVDDVLFLKSDYKIVSVQTSKICYVEGMSEYLRIYSDDMPKPLIVLLSMKRLEDSLPNDCFMRVHRSFIVNLKKIQAVSKMRIILDKGTVIPIGEMYKEHFYAYLNNRYLCK